MPDDDEYPYPALRARIAELAAQGRHAEREAATWQLSRRIASIGSPGFNPYRIVEHAELMRLQEPPPQINPHLEEPPAIDEVERFLVALFLRRYVTYSARRRRFAQMQGAAHLYRQMAAQPVS